jgi:putative DNA modification/repair radical SAM protein
MQLIEKLTILADAAKYDASCASSGAPKRSSKGQDGIGSTNGMGICHSYTPDGRCVALLKILLTNFCLYDCQYCINRRSSDVPRARFNPEEVVRLTLDFYKRNCISGLFLSSGIIRSADYTMEQLIRVARLLRQEHQFRGYIHLKTIPDAAPELIAEAGLYADRLSVNIELPSATSLIRLAPEKNVASIHQAMHSIHLGEREAQEERRAPRFAPAGQSTQMIVGADATDDSTILHNAQSLYHDYACGASTTRPSAPSRRARRRCPSRRHRCCASIACTRRISLCAAMASAPANCWPAPAIWRWTSTPSWPGRWPIASSFRWI